MTYHCIGHEVRLDAKTCFLKNVVQVLSLSCCWSFYHFTFVVHLSFLALSWHCRMLCFCQWPHFYNYYKNLLRLGFFYRKECSRSLLVHFWQCQMSGSSWGTGTEIQGADLIISASWLQSLNQISRMFQNLMWQVLCSHCDPVKVLVMKAGWIWKYRMVWEVRWFISWLVWGGLHTKHWSVTFENSAILSNFSWDKLFLLEFGLYCI